MVPKDSGPEWSVQVGDGVPGAQSALAVLELELFEGVRHQPALVAAQVLQQRHSLDKVVEPLAPAGNAEVILILIGSIGLI